MKQVGFIGIDQYGQHYHIDKHPRKELQEAIGVKHTDKMFIDLKDGGCKHTGYVIGGLWITVYRLAEL